jgi:hypothetical protein
VKRLCADDSAATSVKVGYRQASYLEKPVQLSLSGLFAFALPRQITNSFAQTKIFASL